MDLMPQDEKELEIYIKLMEEMAGDPKEYGKREPGERNTYEQRFLQSERSSEES